MAGFFAFITRQYSLGNEVNLKSFTYFPLLLFKLVLFDFNSPDVEETGSFKMKAKFYFRKHFHKFCLGCLFVISFQMIALMIEQFDDEEVVNQMISDMSTIFLMTLKTLITFLRKKDIYKIFVELQKLFERRESGEAEVKIRADLNRFNRVVKVYLTLYVTLFLQVVFPWFGFVTKGSMNVGSKLWYPFDEYTAKTFPFALFWIDFNVFLFSLFSLACDLLLYALITVIAMEFDILKINLMNLKLKTEPEMSIKECVERHNTLLQLCDKLQDIYGPSLFISFLISSIIMCFKSLQLSTGGKHFEDDVFNIVYMGMIFGQIWLMCTFGQKLIDSSVGIADGAYECDWTAFDNKKIVKQIAFLILRAQKYKKLTGLKFVEISNETFCTVKYLTLLFMRSALQSIIESFNYRFYQQHFHTFR